MRGSSPRTWGTHRRNQPRHQLARFIPTHVGNAPAQRAPRRRRSGSSPRTWGTRRRGRKLPEIPRFIPTHVGNAEPRSPSSCPGTVHPHARGERNDRIASPDVNNGSSPRTWGTHLLGPSIHAPLRFIPTHVGNARSSNSTRFQAPVHPHARGERNGSWLIHFHSFGSSPRTWGTPRGRLDRQRGRRFIPTHVGNALQDDDVSHGRPVHPHARGERGEIDEPLPRNTGSSPRTWGTLSKSPARFLFERFIPTHVGNASSRATSQRTAPVHPHARGERDVVDGSHGWLSGSSPRTWGTHHHRRQRAPVGRFIPTHVGNATRCCRTWGASTVHPHARGERISRRTPACPSVGSSPRTWGTPQHPRAEFRYRRFIPTHVGNAPHLVVKPEPEPVHPHARGERESAVNVSVSTHGSSPRTWGTRGDRQHHAQGDRFIPTHVGNARSTASSA